MLARRKKSRDKVRDAFAILVANGHHHLFYSKRWQFKNMSLHLSYKSTIDRQDDKL
jgi:hypothetical protein